MLPCCERGRTAMAKKILIIEDEENIVSLLEMYLDKEGFATKVACDGGEGFEEFLSFEPDLVLLDIMLPVLNGWTVLGKIRQQSNVPVIMLTAKGETSDKISGLEMGADDYIVKPFDAKEVVARIQAVLRRSSDTEDTDAPKAQRLVFEGFTVDLDAYALTVEGVRMDTPPKELELLYYLASAPNKVFSRNQLLDNVWGFEYYGDSRTVDVHIKRLREKLEKVSDRWYLKTVWGVGYKFEMVQDDDERS